MAWYAAQPAVNSFRRHSTLPAEEYTASRIRSKSVKVDAATLVAPGVFVGSIDAIDEVEDMRLALRVPEGKPFCVITSLNLDPADGTYFGKDDPVDHVILRAEDHATEAEAKRLGRNFHVAFQHMDRAVRGGGAALVHCQQGRSRSATLVAAYLLRASREEGTSMTLDAVAAQLVKARPNISPNTNFVDELEAFEAHLDAGLDPASFRATA